MAGRKSDFTLTKLDDLKQGFQDWIWADPTRREKLTKMYNEKFNSIRPREYDGSHIVFNGMNPEIELREHQKNAVAHILYGGNTLLAHAVGAGKTFEMVAAAMESKRLGLCNKSLFVVPNHLTEQWAAEFLQLYPAANILVATKRDFETKNRKKFCGRIATGDYDAVIIGHSQFEKIPMSIERQRAILEQQLEELTDGIMDLKRNRGENFSIKQLEKSKKSVKQKLEKLNDQSRKDDVVTFEELGVDRLFIDESHYYKNLYLYTKMRNVGGIAQTEAQKSSDLFMKCRYLDELTGGRGTVFATGTPTIRTIDKAAVATQRMKQAYIATKEKAERSVNANSSSAEEYASDKLESGIDEVVHDGAYAFDKAGRKGVETTKENIRTAKDGIQRFKQQRAEQSLRKQASHNTSSAIKTVDKAEKTIKQSATSSGKKTIKFAGKEATKTAQKSVKTAEQTAKTAIKTSQQAAKAAQKTAQATVKASQKAAQAAKATAKATAATIKAAAKATVAAVKAIIAAVKGLIAAIAAGGWVAVVVIIVLCLVGLIAGSVFGIFFSGEDSGTGMSMQTVVQEINQEYDDRLEQEKNSVSYDVLEMSGSRAVWKEVLAVYSVKVNTDPDNPMEVATVDETKKQLLSDIFWEMNDISSRTESKTHTEIEESDDGHGNIVQTETTVTETFLYITVSHKTVDEMAAMYGFNQEQKEYLAELLKDENNQLWSQVLYGIGYSDDQIVTVALSQVGNVGGQPYWSWYGFDSRVEWCACFVSWCANECGYIDAGIIPKYAGCVNGVQWFRDRGQWADGSYEPSPGTIIFFDWEGDGVTDHTGIVQKCENGTVYTVEGNSGDTCRTKTYPVGSSVIYGYGIPAY